MLTVKFNGDKLDLTIYFIRKIINIKGDLNDEYNRED